jgi:hypothetical protein
MFGHKKGRPDMGLSVDPWPLARLVIDFHTLTENELRVLRDVLGNDAIYPGALAYASRRQQERRAETPLPQK